jgi:DNA-binding NtrC family response regulator
VSATHATEIVLSNANHASEMAALDALGDAAVAATRAGEGPVRFAAALRAIRPFLPWRRAVLAGHGGWELADADPEPRSIGPDHPECAAARGGDGPRDRGQVERARSSDAVSVLVSGRNRLYATLSEGVRLCVELTEGAGPPSEAHVRLLRQVGRLFEDSEPALVDSVQSSACPAFPGVLGSSPAMQALFRGMARAAASDAHVHLVGETGTGKDVAARAMHAASARSRRPFVAVNAASLNDDLFEDELFGHVRGAFTGAQADRVGCVGAAEGGTLFIDEVAELARRHQAKLLTFLQDRQYRRVGETSPRTCHARIVTAANVDLRDRVEAGLFREDLWYRLDVIVLQVPPLRHRRQDVLPLANHFLAEAAASSGRRASRIPAAVGRVLEAYSWPGNVRELQNEMTRLWTFAGEGPFGVEQLSDRVRGTCCPAPSRLRDAVSAFERQQIVRALEEECGKRSHAARRLGMTRQGLANKMSRLGL